MSEISITEYILGRADYKGWRCRSAVSRVLVFGKDDKTVSAEGDLVTAFEDIKRQIDAIELADSTDTTST